MVDVVLTGMLWIVKSDLTKKQEDSLKRRYTHINPNNPLEPFSTYLELKDKIGVPFGDKSKLADLLPELSIQDKRISPKFDTPKVSSMSLRDYQEDAMKEILEYISKGGTEFNLSGRPGCVSGDTEFLSPTGWKRISEYNGEEVASYQDGVATFVKPSRYVNEPCDNWVEIKSGDKPLAKVSDEHRVIYRTSKGNIQEKYAYDLYMSQVGIKLITNNGDSELLCDNYIRYSAEPTDRKYCFTVPSGMFLIRYNGVIHVTGNSGKTFMLANLLCKLNTKVLIIANQKMLISQISKELEEVLGEKPNILSSKNTQLGDINVATSQFISQNADVWYEIKKKIGLLVLDEAESLASPTVMRIFQRAPAKYRIMISATFTRSVDHRTGALLDFAGTKKVTLHNSKLLVPSVINILCNEIFIPPHDAVQYILAKGRFYKKDSITYKAIAITKYSVSKNRQVLIACDLVQKQEELRDILNSIGVPAECLNGKTKDKDRKRILEEYESGELKVILGLGVLNAGLSLPKISTIIRLSTPNSEEKLEQLIGRGRRDFEGKEGCFVIDLWFKGFKNQKRMQMYSLKERIEGWKIYTMQWDVFYKKYIDTPNLKLKDKT